MIWLQNCVVVFSCLQQSLALLFKGLQFAVHVCCSVGILHVDDCPVSSVPLYLQANHFTLNASKYWLAPGTDLNFLWDLRSSYFHYFIKPNENKSTHPQSPAHASLNSTLKAMIFHWHSSETVPKSCCNFNDHLTFLSWIFPSNRPSPPTPSLPPADTTPTPWWHTRDDHAGWPLEVLQKSGWVVSKWLRTSFDTNLTLIWDWSGYVGMSFTVRKS